jgi:hypothetical protein
MRKTITLPFLSLFFLLPALITIEKTWRSKKSKAYTVYYTVADKPSIKKYQSLLSQGIRDVQQFFDADFQKKFDVYVHPGRASLDSTWAKDWSSPGFKSECWMVASGVASRMDLLSPVTWDTQACEHRYSDKQHTQQLITHELFHVFHGQLNASGDFNNTENIDWFVEGLATYASGQCDAARLTEVRNAIVNNSIPATLDKFWTGKLKYALSGSVVMYIDKKYGRSILKKLLPYNKKQQVLEALSITEEVLLKEWRSNLTAETQSR